MIDAYKKSLDQLRLACVAQGILASTEDVSNYKRVWARDSVISGLAGWVAGDDKIIAALENSLLLLAKHQGAHGEIPSNVAIDYNTGVESVSYGQQVGRVDSLGWFIIGACHAIKRNSSLEKKLEKSIHRAIQLYETWEFNTRGLVYTPQGGNWADDYLLEGYLLYDQLIRFWALKCVDEVLSVESDLTHLKKLIEQNFVLNRQNSQQAVNPRAFAQALENNEKEFWQAGFKPSGYYKCFDLFANSLTLMLNLGDTSLRSAVIAKTKSLMNDYSLAPAFAPVIAEGQPQYQMLMNASGHDFKNKPFEYHNGGLWPMVNMWLALGLRRQKEQALAEKIYSDMQSLNEKNGYAYYEFYNAKTFAGGGTKNCTWSAAAEVMLENTLLSAERKLIC